MVGVSVESAVKVPGLDVRSVEAYLRGEVLKVADVEEESLRNGEFHSAVVDLLRASGAIAPPKVDLKSIIRNVPDYPKPGVDFKDIMPVLRDPEAFRAVIDQFAEILRGREVNVIAGIESRGFHFAAPLARLLGVPYVPIRKKGKLPGETISVKYELEYGSAELEIQNDAIKPGDRVALIDDFLATAGTAAAAGTLVEMRGGEVEAVCVLAELVRLGGRARLNGYNVHALVSYED